MNKVEAANYELKVLCDHDLFSHVRYGMGYHFVKDDLRDLCEWMEARWNPLEPKRKNVLVQVMRDSFKSTCITQSLPSWYLMKDPNLAILIVSKISTNAQSFHDVQRKRWESKEWESIFGQWRNYRAKWDSEKCFIVQRQQHRKEASLTCAGHGTSLTSQHYDVIILDDPTGPEDMYSPVEREASWRLYKSLFDLIDKHRGLLIVLGTCWHEADVLEKIKKQNPDKIKKGVDPFDIYYRAACENWPDAKGYNFSWVNERFLKQLREDKADIRDFSANYLLKPLPDSFKIFNVHKFYYYNPSEIGRPDWIVMFIDPSLKDGKKNDYAAIVWVGAVKGKLYVLGADIEQRRPSLTIKAIGKAYDRLRTQYRRKEDSGAKDELEIFVYMETVMFAELMKDQAVTDLCADGLYVPINEYPQTRNKIARITAKEKYYASGIVQFRADYEANPSYKLMIEQHDSFPLGDHDDGPDALEGAVDVAMQMI